MTLKNEDDSVLPRIGDYYDRIFNKSWIIFLIVEILFVGAIIIAVTLMLRLDQPEVAIFITMFSAVLVQSLIGYIFLRYTLRPTEVMIQTVAELSGETLANEHHLRRNNPKLQKGSLKFIVDSLYSLESASQNKIEPKDKNRELLLNIMTALPIGIIALDENRNIIAANSLAPTFNDGDKQQILLNFTSVNQSLGDWLDRVAERSINAENIWQRIQNVTPNSTMERKIFDVIAHYEKKAPNGVETIIVTVDRTSEYEVDEDNIDFIALTAHELRGPITVIRGYLDVLDHQLAGRLNTEQHELIDRLNVSAKRLSSYVNNILNVSRYDRQHLKLSLHEDSIANIISDIKDDLDLRARTLNRTLVWNILEQNLPTVVADRSSIGEVISNLIDNAIKYSSDGGVINVFGEVDSDAVSVSVKDSGMGIPANVAEHLFSKFYRSHRSRSKISGTGLGLYISRIIVESHGGQIGVQSTEGQGSTFTFTLPIFSTVADKLSSDNSNKDFVRSGGNWIRNHSRVQK